MRERVLFIYFQDKGASAHTIAKEAKVSKDLASRTILRWNEAATILPKRPGPKVGSHMRGKTDDIIAGLRLMKGRRGVSARIAGRVAGVSDKTMRRAAHALGMDYATGPKQDPMTTEMKQERCKFARAHPTAYEGILWRDALYVDSAPLYMQMTKGKKGMPTWDTRGKHEGDEVHAHSQKVMVYAGISQHGPTSIVTVTGTSGQNSKYNHQKGKKKGTPYDGCCAQEYRDDVVPQLRADAARLFEGKQYLYVHDKASIHKTTNTKLKNEKQPIVHDWPTQGYDCMPIENAWSMLQTEVWRRGPYGDFKKFKGQVTQAWKAVMTKDVCKKLCRSVPDRMRKIVKVKGKHIKY